MLVNWGTMFPKMAHNGLWLGEVAKCALAKSVGFAIFAKPLLSAVLFSHLNNYQNENTKINIKQKMV
jgi:hypothetical protein